MSKPKKDGPQYLAWLDLETTGLDPNNDRILEIAMVITDMAGVQVGEPLDTPIYPGAMYEDDVRALDGMCPFVKDMHTKSGLINYLVYRGASTGRHEAEVRAIRRLERLEIGATFYLAGNTVHFDRSFLVRWMPDLVTRFNHRHVDMSAVALFMEHLGVPRPPKKETHRAMADVQESLALFRYYSGILGVWQQEGAPALFPLSEVGPPDAQPEFPGSYSGM